jgi:diphthine-ammonia ligase
MKGKIFLAKRNGDGLSDESVTPEYGPTANLMNKPKAAVSWSGGKDCCLALERCRQRFDIVALLTVMTEDGSRSRSHGLKPEVLDRQATLLGIPRLSVSTSWSDYEQSYDRLLSAAADEYGVSQVIFGDVFPDAHREWAERVCQKRNMQAVEPLWAEDTRSLVAEFIAKGGLATIVVIRESLLDKNWLGREINAAAVSELEALGIDPCGERGEFHTLVTWFPGFREPLQVKANSVLSHGGCSFIDLGLVHSVPADTHDPNVGQRRQTG